MQSTAQQWLVLTLSPNNPLPLGIVGALQFGPALIPLGGLVADRFPRRVVLMFTQAVSGILAIMLFALTALGLVQLWQVYVLALALGIVNSVDMPSRQAFVSEMVPSEYLLNAVSLNSAQFNASRIVGPGIAGALIAILGVPVMFLLNGISYGAVIVGLLFMRPSELVPVPVDVTARERGQIRALADGVRFVLRDTTVRTTFLMILVVGTLGFNFNVLLPLEATQVLHAGPAIFGLLTSSLGVGALLGALILARRKQKPSNRLLVYTVGAFGLIEVSIAFTPSVALTMVVIAMTGFTMSMFSASANTRVQLASAPEMRGRVMSVYGMVFMGTTPIGNLIVSGVASGSVAMAFIVSGFPCFLSAVAAGWIWHRAGQLNTPRGRNSRPLMAEYDRAGSPAAAALAQPDTSSGARQSPSRLSHRAPGTPRLHPRAAERE
jgi:MFS family permease